MNVYQITAEQIAKAARRAYPGRTVNLIYHGRIVYISPHFCVATDHDGVSWGTYGTDAEYVEWADPAFEGRVAAVIGELIGEPFPTDWMEVGL